MTFLPYAVCRDNMTVGYPGREVYILKKLFLAVLTLALAVILCGCDGVVISIDGVEPSALDSSDKCAFGLIYEGEDGNVFSENTQGYYLPGEEISAHAVSTDGSAFYCWTTGGYLDDGGEVVSYAKNYTFPIAADTWLYANFLDHDCARVLYHANGGTVAETGAETLWDEFSLDYYLYPSTLAEMGTFTREGYTLIGYNTQPDGSGEFYNIGGKAFEDTDGVIELYCVWSEQSPAEDFSFEYDKSSGGWFVKEYLGDGGAVSIPPVYDSEPVVGVSKGAFSGCDTVTSIVFPASMKTLADYSCNDCVNLQDIYLFDSLNYLSDNTFIGDTGLMSVYFGAATPPKFSNWFNNHTKRVEIMRYWSDSDESIMICLGGSSTAYALDAELLQSLLDRDYIVLNCGSNGANLFNMTSEWAMRFLDEGDFLLHITEYSAWQLGGVQCTWETFRSFESCYNIFSWVPAHQYVKFFDAFHDYLNARSAQNDSNYEAYVSNLAPNGYYNLQGTLNVVTRPNGSDTFWQGRNIYFCGLWLYDYMVYYVNAQYEKLDEMGVGYALAFTPLNRNSLYDYQTDEAMEDFEAYLDEVLIATRISDLQENIFEPAVFFDDDYHLAAPAREVYTTQLAEDLNEYFAAQDAQ